MPVPAILAVLLALASLPVMAQGPAAYGTTLDGHKVSVLGNEPLRQAVVLFFVASDCPISNRTFPEMKRVREEFSGPKTAFWFVYPNTGETREAVRYHQTAYDAAGRVVLDTTGDLARLAGATVTPEVAVLARVPGNTQRWQPVYTGRIDDRYVRLGQERPQATEHFAERAVAQVLAGQPVDQPTGQPVGCGIMTASKARP